jgi:hypothetical protein
MANEFAKELQAALDQFRRKHGDDAARKALDLLRREGEDKRGVFGFRHDDAEDRHHRARDAAGRWADDPAGDIEELIEEFCEACGPELAGTLREAANDSRGPAHWARDRRERREARDLRPGFRHYGDGRRLSRDAPDWGPYAEQGKTLENFSERRCESKREESEPLGDRRAHDRALAFDAADDHAIFRAMFPGASRIITR